MPRFVTCGPNEAIIVSGCCHSRPVMRAGGRVFVWPLFHRMQRISLNTMTLNVESSKVHSDEGVPVTVRGVAQVKIQGKDLISLRAAAEMFLDKAEDEIRDIAKAILDGHQRSMIASMKIADIYKSRHEFSKNVQQNAQADLVDMGLTLVSYTLQDISDDQGYLNAMGEDKTVAVRCEARIEVAKSKSYSECKNMDIEQEKREKEIQYEQAIALKQLDFEILQAKYLKENQQNLAKSNKAGDLQVAEMNKRIAVEKFKIILLEKEKEKELILKKKELKELQLANSNRRQADFECYREKKLAEAYKEKTKMEATTEANKIRKIANANAEIIQKTNEAEAEVLHARAEAFKQFGNAAKMEMVLKILPRLTAEIAGPITECKKITSVSQDGSVGFSRITNEIMEVVEQLCDSVGNITGHSLGNNNNSNDDSGGTAHRKSSTESIATTATLGDRRMLSSFTSRMGPRS